MFRTRSAVSGFFIGDDSREQLMVIFGPFPIESRTIRLLVFVSVNLLFSMIYIAYKPLGFSLCVYTF